MNFPYKTNYPESQLHTIVSTHQHLVGLSEIYDVQVNETYNKSHCIISKNQIYFFYKLVIHDKYEYWNAWGPKLLVKIFQNLYDCVTKMIK